MAQVDVYQSLFDMYAQIPFGASLVADSFMELLRVQFTPEEADLATKVGFGGVKIDDIQKRTGIEKEKLKRMLRSMATQGTMWIGPEEDPVYKTISIAGPGLIETGGWANVKFPHSLQLMKVLHKFETEFATKCLPSLGFPTARVWTTPAALPKDARPEENVTEMVRQANNWGLAVCSCRLPHWIAEPENQCHHLLETCLFLGDMARWGTKYGLCRQISCEEAIELLQTCNEDGLVHTYDPNYFICNCCSDCCVFHVGMRETGARLLIPSEFVADIDQQTCNACKVCADRCPVDAITVEDFAIVDRSKCLGCGVCFPTCKPKSVSMQRRTKAEMPPSLDDAVEAFLKNYKEQYKE